MSQRRSHSSDSEAQPRDRARGRSAREVSRVRARSSFDSDRDHDRTRNQRELGLPNTNDTTTDGQYGDEDEERNGDDFERRRGLNARNRRWSPERRQRSRASRGRRDRDADDDVDADADDDDRYYRRSKRGDDGEDERRRDNRGGRERAQNNNNDGHRPRFGVQEEMEKFYDYEADRPGKKNRFDSTTTTTTNNTTTTNTALPLNENKFIGRTHGRDIERTQNQRQNMAQQWLQSNGYEETQKQNEILRKRREVYVGNLIQGVVTPNILADVFNAVLKKVAPELCAREIAGNPVVNVIMDSLGQFGFVELRCFEMAQIALRFDKIDVCGRPMNVGRPKGYIEDPKIGDDCPEDVVDNMVEFGGALNDYEAEQKKKEMEKAKAAMAAAAAAKIAAKMKKKNNGNTEEEEQQKEKPATAFVEEKPVNADENRMKSVNIRLENLISLDEVEAAEKKDKDGAETLLEQLLQDCLEECEASIGMVMAVAVPTPTSEVFSDPILRNGGARCYVKFDREEVAEEGVIKMNGREFDKNIVRATIVSDEEFEKASENVWVS